MLWLVAAGIATIGLSAGLAHSVPGTALGFVFVGFGIGTDQRGGRGDRTRQRENAMPLLHAAWFVGAIAGAGIGACCAACVETSASGNISHDLA
jgi:hypothetical protein